jgi:hypothetical protein
LEGERGRGKGERGDSDLISEGVHETFLVSFHKTISERPPEIAQDSPFPFPPFPFPYAFTKLAIRAIARSKISGSCTRAKRT